jgi:hypothetical protein
MIENSFDPSHAPFTHESHGRSFGFYAPSMAIPMSKFEFVFDKESGKKAGVHKQGFTLQHTPYQLPPNAPAGADQALTTRQFLAPATTVTRSAFLNTSLHFVPVRPGETRSIFKFEVAQAPPSKRKFVPKRLSDMMQDATHFFSFGLGDAVHRFLTQDRKIMQGQDRRKIAQGKWDDMYPTKSDVGVQSFQQWTRKFGRPLYTLPALETSSADRQFSVWERHAQYCPECKRTIARVAAVSKHAKRVFKASFGVSLIGALGGLKFRSLLSASILMLVVSMGSRYLAQYCSTVLERVFVSPSQLARYQMMQIYAK